MLPECEKSPYIIRAAVYKRVECVELRKKLSEDKEVLLYRKVVNIGESIAEFIESIFMPVEELAIDLPTLIEEGNTDVLNREWIEKLANDLLEHSGLFSPLYIVFMDLISDIEAGRNISASGVKEFVQDYHHFVTTFFGLADKRFDGNWELYLRAYMDEKKRYPDDFPDLQYGHVRFELDNDFTAEPFASKSIYEEPEAIEYGIHDPEHSIAVEALYCDTIKDLYPYLMVKAQQAGIIFPQCKCCGYRFATMYNSRREYCDRTPPYSTQSCKEVGWQRNYDHRKSKIPLEREYRRSYKTHYARYRNGIMPKEGFDAWSKDARYMRDKCRAGEITLSEFKGWLDQDRIYYKKPDPELSECTHLQYKSTDELFPNEE